MINSGQIQIRISISQQLGDLLKSKAERLGVPITQLVKHLIIDEVKNEEYPIFKASDATEKAAKEAMNHLDEAVDINNVNEFFNNL
ncbi:MAG TPA: hypothetical protein VFD45_03040 [Patescibacteria group bacterium]|nr:hypothetical protein [Patescibacteria group bacterium]